MSVEKKKVVQSVLHNDVTLWTDTKGFLPHPVQHNGIFEA